MSLLYLGNQVPRKWVFLVMLKNDIGLVCCIFNTHRPILIIFCTQQDKPNFWVHISPGSADTLARGGGITNHRLVAFSLGNISAKNYQNRLMCVEVILFYIIVVFFETQCMSAWTVKNAWESISLRLVGRLFPMSGQHTEKARLPNSSCATVHGRSDCWWP